MEYKNIERARAKKIASKAKKAWIIIASIITAGIILLICVSILVALHEADSGITKSTRHRTGLPTDPEITALINGGRWSAVTLYPAIPTWEFVTNEVQWRLAVGQFYERTGVLVHFYAPDRVGYTKEELEEIYISVFDDAEFKGPFFLYLSAKNTEEWGYQYEYLMGNKAAQFMDFEAISILMESLEYPWRYSDANWRECRYAFALRKAGERMMTPTKSKATPVAIGMLAVVVIIPVFIIIWKKRHKKDEETYRILNTSLDTLAAESEEEKLNQ